MGGPEESGGHSLGSASRRATAAELRVVRDLLVDPLGPQSRKIRLSGLSRRTYQTALQRAYARRWVMDRYLPSPTLTRLPYATFLLARPATGRAAEVAGEIRRSTNAVLLWSMAETTFSVAFMKSPASLQSLARRLEDTGLCPRGQVHALSCPQEGVPIYFDFEGVWARYGGLPGTVRYPQGLPVHPGSAEEGAVAPTPRVLESARSILARVGRPGREAATHSGLLGGWSHRMVDRGLLRGGWVERRSFLDPISVARTLRDFAGGITVVHGTLRPSGEAGALTSELFERSRVHPFLLASDAHSILIGFLSVGPQTQLAAAPSRRVAVRATLKRWLDSFAVTRQSLATVDPILNHRYENLLGGSPLDQSAEG
jgi:hypothetical protein